MLRAGRKGSAPLDGHPWLLADTAKLHVTIMGGLAGFAVTGIVLLVSLARDRTGIAQTSFDTVLVMFIVAIFCINGAGFALAALTPLSPRYPGIEGFDERHGRNIVIADMQLTMLSLAFLWLAVVGIVLGAVLGVVAGRRRLVVLRCRL